MSTSQSSKNDTPICHELQELIDRIQSTPQGPFHYFARCKIEQKAAVKLFNDSGTDIIVVDHKGRMWQHGKRIRRKL